MPRNPLRTVPVCIGVRSGCPGPHWSQKAFYILNGTQFLFYFNTNDTGERDGERDEKSEIWETGAQTQAMTHRRPAHLNRCWGESPSPYVKKTVHSVQLPKPRPLKTQTRGHTYVCIKMWKYCRVIFFSYSAKHSYRLSFKKMCIYIYIYIYHIFEFFIY